MGGTSVFRITKQVELTEQSNDRDIILQHYLFKKVVLGIILLLLLFVPLTIGVVINPEKLFKDMNAFYLVFFICYFLFTVIYLIYANCNSMLQ